MSDHPDRHRKITVQLVDDHAVFRAGLRMLINSQLDMEVVGEAADAAGAVRVARASHPTVVLLEICLPGDNGIEVIGTILEAAPSSKILILSMYDDPAHLRRALDRGAAGYVAKRATDSEVMLAIRTVSSGQTYAKVSLAERPNPEWPGSSPWIPELVKAQLGSLSPRERDILLFLALGCTNKEIAGRLNLSVKSVGTYRFRVSKKLGATGRADLVRFAIQAGLLAGTGYEPQAGSRGLDPSQVPSV